MGSSYHGDMYDDAHLNRMLHGEERGVDICRRSAREVKHEVTIWAPPIKPKVHTAYFSPQGFLDSFVITMPDEPELGAVNSIRPLVKIPERYHSAAPPHIEQGRAGS
jgi:hypothetical protein